MNTVWGPGFSLNFAFTAACLTMDITYNVGRGWDHNSTSQGATDYGNASACYAHGTEWTCSADAGNNCRWFPYANYGLVTTTNGSTSSTPLATCNAAQNQSACAGETINVPWNEWWGIPYSYISGWINGCYWNADPVMRTCNDADSEFACELFRPGCTWNQNVWGAVQNRPVVCRNELGGIVPDSYCTQPKPDTTQPWVCNVFTNGICWSSLGTPSSTAPTANLCSQWYAPASPTSFTNANNELIWLWSCQGTAGGTMSYCSAPMESVVVQMVKL
jgi:hypothetical protein